MRASSAFSWSMLRMSSTTPMLRICSSSRAMRASLSLPCLASSWRSSSMRRRASASSKRPARAGNAAAAMSAAASASLFARIPDVGAAILRPRGLVMARRPGLFLAVARGLDAVAVGTQHRHHAFHRLGAALAEREVVLAAAALVGVALDAHALLAMIGDIARMRLQQAAELVLHLVRIEVE